MPDEAEKPYVTAAEMLGIEPDKTPPTPGMSITPGLREVPNSPVPNSDRVHVMGPQQAACDPLLAGLDTQHKPMTRAENRAITNIDGEMVKPSADQESEKLPGPNSTSAPAAESAPAEAAKVTPSAILPSAAKPKEDEASTPKPE
jgi:hypothetical protein